MADNPRQEFAILPTGGALGAEVTGVDLANLTDELFSELYDAWLKYQVLFFRDQELSLDAHIALGRRFGELEIHPFIKKVDDDHKEIIEIDSERGGTADSWHSDVTFSATPPMASILKMIQLPEIGGDTLWSNQYLAYETMSEPMRCLLDDLTAVHTGAPFGHPEVTIEHPAVVVHPETGRRTLFVNRQFTSHFLELRPEESSALLEQVCSWAEQPNFQTRFRWTPNAVGIWDNRCTQHYGVNDFTARRVLHRVTVMSSERPVGNSPRWEPFSEGPRRSARYAKVMPRTGYQRDADANTITGAQVDA